MAVTALKDLDLFICSDHNSPKSKTVRRRLTSIPVRCCHSSRLPRARKFDAFSLSNFSSYTTEDDYRQTWEKIVIKAKHGARFCERQFLVYRTLEQYVAGESLDRDQEMETLFELTDSTLFYKFLIGTIHHKS
jgi:hypothetical protein